MLLPVVDRSDLGCTWDAVVVGAGPAGSVAAKELASRGFKVLLVDKSHFPRGKVCGCCLSKSCVDGLKQAGLEGILADASAVALECVMLFDGSISASLPLRGGFSISRDRFDSALIASAISGGVHFLPGYVARVLELGEAGARVLIAAASERLELQAKIVVVADGLSGHALDGISGFEVQSSSSSRIGTGTVLSNAPSFYRPGKIYMCCADNGYVGLVLLEDGRLDVACAFDHQYLRRMNGPGAAAQTIITACNLPVPPDLVQSRWLGTETLTRRRSSVFGQRVFVVGDACGYAEPFTGEGMSWAIWSALTAAPLIAQTIIAWSDEIGRSWKNKHNALISKRHRRSNIIAAVLRKNRIRRLALSVLSRAPGLVSPLVSGITGHKSTLPLADELAPFEKEHQWSQ